MSDSTAKIKTVDFVPEFGLNGDYKKVTEYDLITINAKIVPLITLCLMEQGSNQLMPDMGLRTTFVKLPFSERNEVEGVISEINRQFKQYMNFSVECKLDNAKTNWVEGDVYFAIDIEGIPGTLSLGISKDNVNDMQPFNIKHPAIFVK